MKTSEAQLMMLFKSRMEPYKGMTARGNPEMQIIIKDKGTDIVKALQLNHGHSLADSVGFMRQVLNELDIV